MTPSPHFATKYGQVFLRNRKIAEREVSLLGEIRGKSVLEIGCGEGIVTDLLLSVGSKVTGLEPDHRHFSYLLNRFSGFVKSGQFVPVKQTFEEFPPGGFDFVFGNIPYSVSSKIIFRLPHFQFTRAVIMVQKEFGERMVAVPGSRDYSRLSVSTWFQFVAVREFFVSRNEFDPVPEVDSVVLTLMPKNLILAADRKFLEEVVKRIFSNRRKTLAKIFGKVPEEMKGIRGESLPPQAIADLAAYLKEQNP